MIVVLVPTSTKARGTGICSTPENLNDPIPVWRRRRRAGPSLGRRWNEQTGPAGYQGTVLVGGGGALKLLETLAAFFQSIGAQTVAHRQVAAVDAPGQQGGLMTGRWDADGKPGAKVITTWCSTPPACRRAPSPTLYQFFHDAARSVLQCGREPWSFWAVRPEAQPPRARPPSSARWKVGAARWPRKFKKAIGVQLVYRGRRRREDQLQDSTLRFPESPRSA